MENLRIENYVLTETQMKYICKYYGENYKDLEMWEISEYVDRFIDDMLYASGAYKN